MNNKLLKSLIIAIILLAAAGFLQPLKAFAASGSVEITAEKKEVKVGEVICLYLKVDADTGIGEFECLINYDENKLAFQMPYSSDQVKGDDGLLRVYFNNETSATDNKTMIIKFYAIAPGSVSLSLSSIKMKSFTDSKTISVSAKNISVLVTPAEGASGDSSLQSLKISPGSLSPEFSPEVFEYRTSVSVNTDRIFVGAIATNSEHEDNDKNSTVQIYGADKLYPGENKVTVLVTAEDGSKSEYIIYVTKLEGELLTATPTPAEEPAPTENPEPTGGLSPEGSEFEWKFEAAEENGKLVLWGNYKFEIVDKPQNVAVPQGFSEGSRVISGRTITVYLPDATSVEKPYLLYLKKEGEDPAFYKYDLKENTIQRYSCNSANTADGTGEADPDNINKLNKANETITELTLVIAMLAAVWLLTSLLLIYFVVRKKR